MSNFMGFVYGTLIARGKKHQRPPSEREIIEQEHLMRELESQAPANASFDVGEAVERLPARTGQRLEPERQG
jgi:hypothetical protein